MSQNQIDPALIASVVEGVLASMDGSSIPVAVPSGSGGLDKNKDYPLGTRRPDLVKSASGKSLNDITLDRVNKGEITFDDVKIRSETLEYQAQIAESSDRPAIAHNLRRAAEMTRIPDERVLEIYTALRPYRSTKEELLGIASELESTYQAKICAAFVREACDVYEKRNRLKK
jgi:propanediol dehydratase small subunit